MNSLTEIAVCPYEQCTRKTQCRTNDYQNCPVYKEYDLNKDLFPNWNIESIYEQNLKMFQQRINRGESIRGRML